MYSLFGSSVNTFALGETQIKKHTKTIKEHRAKQGNRNICVLPKMKSFI